MMLSWLTSDILWGSESPGSQALFLLPWNPVSTPPPSQANSAPTHSSGFSSDLSLRKPFLTATLLSFHLGRVRLCELP